MNCSCSLSDFMANFSSPTVDLQLNLTSAVFPSGSFCFFFGRSFVVWSIFATTYVLLLFPLCILILCRGLQKLRQRAAVSHADCFTFHTVAMEMIGVLGYVLCSCGIYRKTFHLASVGMVVSFVKWYGEVLFHILTCLERYLAVMHPITYLSFRSERGIRIRNAAIACVWLLCLVWTCLCEATDLMVWDLCFLILALVLVSFCSVSVLCVLIRPGPGGQGDDRSRVDQHKRRAFFTIMSILGVVVLRVVSNLVWEMMKVSTGSIQCIIVVSAFWFNIPSSLVLPALFLRRERKKAYRNA